MYRDHRDKGYPDLPPNDEPLPLHGSSAWERCEDKMEIQPIKHPRPSARRLIIMGEVLNERDRQDAKWGEQNHPIGERMIAPDRRKAKERSARETCKKMEACGLLSWVDICQEELQEVNGAEDDEHAREELLQLAACCVAAIECIDRREAKKHDVKTCEDRNCLHPTCVAINGG